MSSWLCSLPGVCSEREKHPAFPPPSTFSSKSHHPSCPLFSCTLYGSRSISAVWCDAAYTHLCVWGRSFGVAVYLVLKDQTPAAVQGSEPKRQGRKRFRGTATSLLSFFFSFLVIKKYFSFSSLACRSSTSVLAAALPLKNKIKPARGKHPAWEHSSRPANA